MLMTIAGAFFGFVAGMAFAVAFPLGLYFRRLVFGLRGPVPFEVGGEKYLLGPEDMLQKLRDMKYIFRLCAPRAISR